MMWFMAWRTRFGISRRRYTPWKSQWVTILLWINLWYESLKGLSQFIIKACLKGLHLGCVRYKCTIWSKKSLYLIQTTISVVVLIPSIFMWLVTKTTYPQYFCDWQLTLNSCDRDNLPSYCRVRLCRQGTLVCRWVLVPRGTSTLSPRPHHPHPYARGLWTRHALLYDMQCIR